MSILPGAVLPQLFASPTRESGCSDKGDEAGLVPAALSPGGQVSLPPCPCPPGPPSPRRSLLLLALSWRALPPHSTCGIPVGSPGDFRLTLKC